MASLNTTHGLSAGSAAQDKTKDKDPPSKPTRQVKKGTPPAKHANTGPPWSQKLPRGACKTFPLRSCKPPRKIKSKKAASRRSKPLYNGDNTHPAATNLDGLCVDDSVDRLHHRATAKDKECIRAVNLDEGPVSIEDQSPRPQRTDDDKGSTITCAEHLDESPLCSDPGDLSPPPQCAATIEGQQCSSAEHLDKNSSCIKHRSLSPRPQCAAILDKGARCPNPAKYGNSCGVRRHIQSTSGSALDELQPRTRSKTSKTKQPSGDLGRIPSSLGTTTAELRVGGLRERHAPKNSQVVKDIYVGGVRNVKDSEADHIYELQLSVDSVNTLGLPSGHEDREVAIKAIREIANDDFNLGFTAVVINRIKGLAIKKFIGDYRKQRLGDKTLFNYLCETTRKGKKMGRVLAARIIQQMEGAFQKLIEKLEAVGDLPVIKKLIGNLQNVYDATCIAETMAEARETASKKIQAAFRAWKLRDQASRKIQAAFRAWKLRVECTS